jgi:hypothetical protein
VAIPEVSIPGSSDGRYDLMTLWGTLKPKPLGSPPVYQETVLGNLLLGLWNAVCTMVVTHVSLLHHGYSCRPDSIQQDLFSGPLEWPTHGRFQGAVDPEPDRPKSRTAAASSASFNN